MFQQAVAPCSNTSKAKSSPASRRSRPEDTPISRRFIGAFKIPTMTRCFILFTLLVLIGSLQTQAQKKHQQADPFAGLDTAFVRVIGEFHAAGFAVAVVQKDSLIYARGFGYRDYEHKLPVTPHTLFAIGSCTKAFTASLLGQLEA